MKCFIVCPIGEIGSDTRKRADQLLEHVIKPVCDKCGINTVDRVDLMNNAGSITNQILNCLREYDIVIADLTEHNPNVFYELGYRASLNKPYIQLKAKVDTLPFDVASINTYDYDLTDLDAVKQVKERLVSLISEMQFDKQEESIDMTYKQLLTEIYKIQDDLQTIKKQPNVDNSTINLLIDKLSNVQAKTNDQVLMETLLPKLLDNPESLETLIKIGSDLPNVTKFK